MNTEDPIKQNISRVYQTFVYCNALDKFSHISAKFMSHDSDLAIALDNLQSANNEKRDLPKDVHYEHYSDNFTLWVINAGIVGFAIERIFTSGTSVDLVAYVGQEEYLHRAAFIHTNGYTIKIPVDALSQPLNMKEYLTKFLATIQNKKEQIITAVQDPDLHDQKSESRKELESILASSKPST